MEKSLIKASVKVSIAGKPEEYINSPIIKDNEAIGVITDCIEEDGKYNLDLVLWQNVGVEFINNEPCAVVINA